LNSTSQGRTALVTGASRGIGRSIALRLGGAGMRIIGTATSEAGVQAIRETLEKNGIGGSACVLDVADAASVSNLEQWLKNEGFAPSILVNNAGITRDNLLVRMKDEDWEAVINTDLTSIYRLTRLCLRAMMKERFGRIINITSVVALSGNAGQVNYAAAKAGIIGFTKSLAREVGSRGITVNAVAPGYIATDMTGVLDEAQQKELLSRVVLGRLGKPEEVAEAVAFLASESADYITGETINVNGGLYMA
jgi:3-oxoacyl-[acyl-carrier protein] reductase